MKFSLPIAFALLGLLPHAHAQAAAPDSLLLEAANAVSGDAYLKSGKSDATLGRLEGNGQNWMEFIAAGTDPGQNTIDLRGWQIDWSYDKDDGTSHGSGVITFSQDPTWAAVPQGTMITINEDQSAWYLVNTPPAPGNPDGDPYTDPNTGLPGGGMQRVGDINGFGQQAGSAFNPALDTMRTFNTNTAWNPAAQGGANWNMNIFAGQGLNSSTGAGQYFSFSGTVTTNSVNDQGGTTTQVGQDPAAGLFAVNNDNWQMTIKDAQGNVIEGPIGEAVPGWGLTNGVPNGAGGVGNDELVKLQSFISTDNPTAASYQGVTISNYADGSSSTYGQPNQWTNTLPDGTKELVTQDLSPLRNWFGSILPGDSNLNGTVNFADFQNLQNNYGQSGKGWQNGDFNGDGTVNFADFQMLQNNYGQSSGGASLSSEISSVPEPSTVALLSMGLLALVGFRRRLVSQ